jgi:hypothetical protein
MMSYYCLKISKRPEKKYQPIFGWQKGSFMMAHVDFGATIDAEDIRYHLELITFYS